MKELGLAKREYARGLWFVAQLWAGGKRGAWHAEVVHSICQSGRCPGHVLLGPAHQSLHPLPADVPPATGTPGPSPGSTLRRTGDAIPSFAPRPGRPSVSCTPGMRWTATAVVRMGATWPGRAGAGRTGGRAGGRASPRHTRPLRKGSSGQPVLKPVCLSVLNAARQKSRARLLWLLGNPLTANS